MRGKKNKREEDQEPAPGVRITRIRLLSSELDTLRTIALERTRSIDTKSSFVVVAAGVLASATFAGLVDARSWFIGLVPLILTLATIITASAALWPGKIDSLSGRRLIDRWVDSCETPEQLEDYLLEAKAKEIQHRDARNERRSKATKAGFVLLVSSVTATLLVAGINAAILGGEHIDAPISTTNSRTAGTP